MEISIVEYLVLSLATFFIVGFLTPVMRKLALKRQVLDLPNSSHKTHVVPIPYMGGIAIMVGILVVSYTALLYQDRPVQEILIASSVLIPATFLGLIGLADDIRNLPPFPKFVAQSLAGIFTAIVLILTSSIGNPSGNQVLDIAITILWVVGITNSINFFDNLDGGASGAVAVISTGVFLIAFSNGQYLVAALSIVTTGATMGFLLWNRSPARIYMGDAGALFLGVLTSVLALRLDPEVDSKLTSFAVPLLLLAVPILDTSVAVVSRVKRGVSPFQGGQDHLSHRLMKRGFSKRESAFSLWSLAGIFVAAAVGVSTVVANPLAFLVLSTGFWLILFLVFLYS